MLLDDVQLALDVDLLLAELGPDLKSFPSARHLASGYDPLSLEEFTRATATFLSSAARLLASRREAPALWERLRTCSQPGQLDLARLAAEFHTAGFVELLCEESRNAAADSAARALHLASCAAEVASAVPGDEGMRSRLAGYAGVHRASALRVGGDG